MAKELPYFRFTCQEWQNGDITLESMATQGVFINICCYYWLNNCDVDTKQLIKKFKQNNRIVKELFKLGIVGDSNGKICISFLDLQWSDLLEFRKKKQIAGSKGGKQKSSNATAKLKHNSSYKEKENYKEKDNTFAGSKKPARKRDPFWDEIVKVWGWDPKTKNERSRVGKIASDLKKKTDDPEVLKKFKNEYERKNPDWTCSPEAVLKHWDDLKPKEKTKSTQSFIQELKPEEKMTPDDIAEIKKKATKMGILKK